MPLMRRWHSLLQMHPADAFPKRQLPEQRSRLVLEGHSSGVTAVAMDDTMVVSGSDDNTLRLWDRRSGECVKVLEGHHSDVVSAVAMDDTVVRCSC